MRGRNVHYKLDVDFLTAANGGQQRITLPDGKQLGVTIPEGVADGQTIRLKGLGHPGRGDAPAGDAIIRSNGAIYLPGPLTAGGPLRRRAELEALTDDAQRLENDLAEQDRILAAAGERLAMMDAEAVQAAASVETARALERQAALEADDARRQVANVERELAGGTPLGHITRHVLGLFRNQPGGRAFRRVISEQAHRTGAGVEVLEAALAQIESLPLEAVA